MGYSHSWYRNREINPDKMNLIRTRFKAIIPELSAESKPMDAPDFKNELDDICFGSEIGTCEPMVFCRISSARQITAERANEPWQAGKCFEYCKTEHLPYDLAVTSLLLIVKFYLKDEIRIFSDGDVEKWVPTFKLCSKLFDSKHIFSVYNNELLIKQI